MTEHRINDALPPVPDANGEQRPPTAPSTGTTDLPYNARPIRTSYGPDYAAANRYQFGPEDEPALEMVTQSCAARWRIAAAIGVLQAALVLALCVIVALVASIAISWWGWIVLVALVIVAATVRQYRGLPPAGPIVAGAWWAGTDRRHAVRTYQLVEIGQGVVPDTPWVILVDANGHTMLLNCALAETHPALWALIYNGIRHSVADGATIHETACDRLFGPREPS